MSNWSRDFDRRASAHTARLKGERLERLGLSDAMWQALQDLHLARLRPPRGIVAPLGQPTFAALETRGLATWAAHEGEYLWRATDAGAALVKKGRPQ